MQISHNDFNNRCTTVGSMAVIFVLCENIRQNVKINIHYYCLLILRTVYLYQLKKRITNNTSNTKNMKKLSKTHKNQILSMILNRENISYIIAYCEGAGFDTTKYSSPVHISNGKISITYRNENKYYYL
jgi:uncharacterized membrane protein